jgi:uncharacterized protein (DUF2235 family)
MAKSIVICCDGTGNTSRRSVSNVFRTVEMLALNDPRQQVAIYDQGIGTPRRGLKEAQALSRRPEGRALIVLPAPLRVPLFGRVDMALGIGLRSNVRQTYQALGMNYEKGDTVYLFGFSRGAFTVRALAGLIHRCGLPRQESASSNKLFADAWRRYSPMQFEWTSVNEWRNQMGQRKCPVHFLGVWDTVKSYGGIRPILLPHLRHNPIVKAVRHAVALDEKRGWFNVTTWGRLDCDRKHAMTRLQPWEISAIEHQEIMEVWFRGCHSDVGGGDEEEVTAWIARHWMLSEAAHSGEAIHSSDPAHCPLVFNSEGLQFLERQVPTEVPQVHESLSRAWCIVDLIPRLEIDNSSTWPARVRQKKRTYHALRRPELLLREGTVSLHETVRDPPFGRAANFVKTRPVARRVCS